jgi:hypothetical protein
MPVPTKINNHSNNAILRLPDFLSGKQNAEAILRGKSAARVDVITVEVATYTVTINGDDHNYSSVLSDTAITISDELVTLINAGSSDGKALKINATDEFFYIKPVVTADTLTIVVTDNLNWRRIGLVDQVQELEDILYDLLIQRGISVAVGVQLDRIGILVGLPRAGGQSDIEYRALLEVQITRNLSYGSGDTLINITAAMTESSIVTLDEYFPAEIEIIFNGDRVSGLADIIDSVAMGGVKVSLVEYDGTPFGFEGDPDILGFSSTLDTGSGGELASKVL